MEMENIPVLTPDLRINIDRRLLAAVSNEFAFEVFVPSTLAEHRARKEFVRSRILLSAGLKPALDLPAAPAELSPGESYHGVLIKAVRLETVPGLKLTGSLYLPEKISAPLPGVLCPHGHWNNGRVHHAPNGGVVMRCFQLARLGFAVFSYDMIGYNDNNDFPHRWSGELKRDADLAGISTFGLQTLNSMRAVDFLCGLSEVDSARIACTGASGGASQTWFVSALDDRIKVMAPVCMLSAHYQGGCSCEEGPLLRRTGLTSFDVVASFAPRPVMLPSVTGDWSNLNPDYEIPRLKQVYSLYHAADAVESFHYADVHNYNRRTREHVYAFLVRQLQGIDRGQTIPEEEIEPPPPELLWHGHVKPVPAAEPGIGTAFRKLAGFWSTGVLDVKNDFPAWKNTRRELLREMLENGQPPTRNVVERVDEAWDIPEGKVYGRIISRRGVGDRLVSLHFTPPTETGRKKVILLAAHAAYPQYLGNGPLSDRIRSLLARSLPVRLLELTGSGSTAGQLEYAVRNPDSVSSAFDESYFSMRVQDIITASVLLRERGFSQIRILAEGNAVPPALAAAALTGLPVTADLAGLDENVWHDRLNFQPLIGRIGGLAGLLMLNAAPGNRFLNPAPEYRKLLEKHGLQTGCGTLAECCASEIEKGDAEK